MTTQTIKSLASAMYSAFITDTRANGEEFIRLADGSPEWMTNVIHAGHGDLLPDDYRYRTIREACGFLADLDEDEDLDDAPSPSPMTSTSTMRS